jgi:hypothetical protein
MNNISSVNNLIYKHKHTKNSVSGIHCPPGMVKIVVSKENFGGASNACAKQIRFQYHLDTLPIVSPFLIYVISFVDISIVSFNNVINSSYYLHSVTGR